MATLTAKNIADLNKSNRAAQNAGLGTKLAAVTSASATQLAIVGFSGSKTVSATEMNGSRVVVTTGIAAPKGFMFQVLRSGSVITNQAKSVSGSTAGDYILSSGSGYMGLTTGDVVTYLGFA